MYTLFMYEQVVERIKTCYDQIEESNDYIASGKWLKASEGFEKASSLIRWAAFTYSIPYRDLF
jgi:hypothetical protein